MQDVLDQRIGDDRQQDSVLKAKDQLEKKDRLEIKCQE